MLPKIGICFTLCWILLYCSWRISEITSAVQSCNEKLSDLHTLCLKDTLHKSSPCACTWRQRDGALVTALPGAGTQNFSSILCSKPINMGWMVWAWHPHTHPGQSSSRDFLGTHTSALQPLPSSQPTGAGIQQGVSQPVPCSPISYSSCLHFQWYQVASLPSSPGMYC